MVDTWLALHVQLTGFAYKLALPLICALDDNKSGSRSVVNNYHLR